MTKIRCSITDAGTVAVGGSASARRVADADMIPQNGRSRRWRGARKVNGAAGWGIIIFTRSPSISTHAAENLTDGVIRITVR